VRKGLGASACGGEVGYIAGDAEPANNVVEEFVWEVVQRSLAHNSDDICFE
jgi:hypothetical protein